jgi:hypothetical protein
VEGFVDWADDYCRVFGLGSDAEMRSVLALERVFELAGFTAAELKAATEWLSVHSPKLPLTDHRVAIRDCVLQLRAKRNQQLIDQAERSGQTCSLCGGSGFVTVPHLRSLTDGVWDGGGTFGRRYTQAVSCTCGIGERKRESTTTELKDGRKPPTILGLSNYERTNPHWADQLRIKAAEDIAAARADQMAAAADKVARVGPDVEKVLRKLVRE